MAVGVLGVFPTAPDQYDQVNATMDVANNPPDGLIIHTAGPAGDGMRIFDVWESEDAYRRFEQERLMPALTEVFGEEAMQGGTPPEIYQLHNVQQP